MKGEDTRNQSEKSSDYFRKMLKVQVVSTERDNIYVNVPINLVKAVLKAGVGIASKVPQAEMYVKDIDIDLLLQAIDNEIDGKIVDVAYANGDKVSVVIE
jgi:hypothetical protein